MGKYSVGLERGSLRLGPPPFVELWFDHGDMVFRKQEIC